MNFHGKLDYTWVEQIKPAESVHSVNTMGSCSANCISEMQNNACPTSFGLYYMYDIVHFEIEY